MIPIPTKLILRFVALAGLLAAFSVRADVRMPALFTEHMVLQQGMSVPVWGWAAEGETVTVSFRNQRLRAIAKDGKWSVQLRRLKAGGPDTLTISGKNQIEIRNVLVGEVWICSGQSNMEWPLRRSFEPDADIAASANARLRLFTVPKLKADQPVDDVKAQWVECGPQTVPNFSAVAYYFGRDLERALGVPVGLIHTSWGGSPAEVWMSGRALSSNPRYNEEILGGHRTAFKAYQDNLAAFEKETAELAKEGKRPTRNRPGAPWKPTELYNGMIAPLIPYAINGAIWYQGESNAGRAEQYRSLFADMIRNWRADWTHGDFTFLEVQLAPWDKSKRRTLAEITAAPGDSDWAELREAQVLATKSLPKVGIAVITDVGDKDDIHPTKKAPVGARLALAAQKIAYNKRVAASGPTYKSVKIRDGKAVLTFDHVGSGLAARDGALTGFSVAGADRKFVWANAEIRGRTVVVSAPQVAEPVAVRYGWSDFPVVNLWNADGLPASPFRTDDFPLTTQGKK